jgi:beta-lactamase superfamily II metal-dependent hydrolase
MPASRGNKGLRRPVMIVWWRTQTAAILIAVLLSFTQVGAPAGRGETLEIYFVDVEGGQSTLFVTPKGLSLLIDTGWAGNDARDAERILAVAKQAGLHQLDYVLLTHYHPDHAGGLAELAARIPIRATTDHGENAAPVELSTVPFYLSYEKLLAGGKVQRLSPRPGDALPIPELHPMVVSSAGAVLERALPGAGQSNAECATAAAGPVNQIENPRSLGTHMVFGELRILDLGDLTADKEAMLMCPANKLGNVDIFVVSHHGTASSNSSVLVHAIAPRVAIMDNGARKGGSPSVWQTIESSPGLEDLWQLHTAEEAGAKNVLDAFIANLPGPDGGNYLKLTAWPDGSFEVFNSRTQSTKKYAAR